MLQEEALFVKVHNRVGSAVHFETTKKKAEILRFQDSHLIIYIVMWLLALDDVAVLFLAEGFEAEGVVRVVEVGGGVDGLSVDARLEV